jgi:hypothetical protein
MAKRRNNMPPTPKCAGCGKEPGLGHETYCKYLTGEEPIEYITPEEKICACGATTLMSHAHWCPIALFPTEVSKHNPCNCGATTAESHADGCPNNPHYRIKSKLEEQIEYTTLGGNRCPFCGVTKGYQHKDGCQELHRPTPRIPGIVMLTKDQFFTPVPKEENTLKPFAITPHKFTLANDLSFFQGIVIERICNYNRPEGRGQEALYEIINMIKSFIESRDEMESRKVKV